MQASATRLIKRWGGPGGNLIRSGVKRKAFMAMGEWKPAERALVEEGAVRILVSAPQSIPPDYKLDLIEFPINSGMVYRIVKPVRGERPDGVTVIKYDCECMEGEV
jgi:hypothetical protein